MPLPALLANPAVISAGLGAASSLLGGDGGDKFMSLKDKYGKHLVGDIKDLQQQALDLPGQEFYPGQTFANLNPLQQQAYFNMAAYGAPGGIGRQIQGNQLSAGRDGLRNLQSGRQYTQDMVAGGAPQFQFDQGTFDQIYNNPNLQGMVDAATRDITRDLNWNTLPGIDQAAADSGNMASSRAGVAEGLARGMAQDRISDVTADIYSNAFNQATAGGMSGGQQNLQAGLAQDRNILNSFQNMANIGLPQLGAAYNTGVDNMQLMLGGGQGFQNQIQKAIDENVARHNFDQQAPYTDMANRLGIINSTIPGGGQLQNTPSAFDRMTQGALMGLGAYDAFQGIGGSTPTNPAAMFNTGMGNDFSNLFGNTGMAGAGFGMIPGYGG